MEKKPVQYSCLSQKAIKKGGLMADNISNCDMHEDKKLQKDLTDLST